MSGGSVRTEGLDVLGGARGLTRWLECSRPLGFIRRCPPSDSGHLVLPALLQTLQRLPMLPRETASSVRPSLSTLICPSPRGGSGCFDSERPSRTPPSHHMQKSNLRGFVSQNGQSKV